MEPPFLFAASTAAKFRSVVFDRRLRMDAVIDLLGSAG
jgi:hypothetical protein